YTFGDSFTIGGLYGGPAFIGNTRNGYVDESFEQELEFIKLLKTDGCLGRVRAKTQVKYTKNRHVRLTNNLLGCPEFKMWIKTPQLINYTLQQYQTNTNTTIIADKDSYLTYIRLSDGSITNSFGTSTSDNIKFTFPNANVVATLNGEYKIPRIMGLSLNDVTIKTDGYFFVKNITTPTTTVSHVPIIKFDKAHITFDVDGYVDLKQKLVVDDGSDVTFIVTGEATFNRIEVRNGSRLTIESNGYSMEGESICELGSELIIK
ncbi:MAG: hypothetical protein NC453_31090, partial [Muribaculum sp.]|nr:hypothetical protein [Muribaculum sp.]